MRADQFNKAFARLSAYEDTGLEPEEICAVAGLVSTNCAKAADAIDKLLSDDSELDAYRALGPIDHLRELVEAEREQAAPLTLEELRERDGKWVWAVAEDEPEAIPVKIDGAQGWVKAATIEPLKFSSYGPGTAEYYGWVAYDRPPEQ